jgi:hypothetical protein
MINKSIDKYAKHIISDRSYPNPNKKNQDFLFISYVYRIEIANPPSLLQVIPP